MTTAPRGAMEGSTGLYDPSILFDLEDILMSESNDIQSHSLVHTPIKEEPEFDHEDVNSRYVHSPIGLPIPSRTNGFGMKREGECQMLLDPTLTHSSMWGGNSFTSSSLGSSSQPGGRVPFPVTPFNTPLQGPTYMVAAPDLKSFFLSSNSYASSSSADNPTLSMMIKEELPDLDTDLETMKAISMFPMEEDDIIFQVDKNDLIQGPTLAELNANDESLLCDLNFDDFVLPVQMSIASRSRSYAAAISNSVDSDRSRRTADFYPTFSGSRNMLGISGEDELSQLSSTQMGFDLEQLPSVDVNSYVIGGGTHYLGENHSSSSSLSSPLSASLPANFSHVGLSKLTRRTEEGRVKPPPPYPTSPPQKNNSSALQELLSIRSPGRLPSPGAGGSHSPSPTAPHGPPPRPGSHMSGGVRPRTSSAASAAAQSIPRSPSLANTNPLLLARLSSSAPGPSGAMAAASGDPSAWQRREPRNRLLSTSSLVEEVHGSTSSISTVGILSPGSFDFSHDEGFDSEDDSDHYEDLDDSDSDSGGSDEEGRGDGRAGGCSGMSKKERFFWQYNVQAKGPKGQKINLTPETVDPHVLNKVQDPVFSPYCSVDGIKHSGKARRGDGNDLTPNPRKLHSIGRELDKLNRLINDMTPVSELPMAVRPKSRKEKNKLASRACRLKKKAQHEANKVKLYGLEQEHRKLMIAIAQTKIVLVGKFEVMSSQMQLNQTPNQDASCRIERIAKSMTMKIAGHSTEFVNRVLERVKGGEPSGGLDEI